ncbi:MAG: GNAT family N-acetyltransferase, partial [Eubacteriales bacterium]|nr:GNAT family N-acetyltransferase [Eubacteriales bacterium]
MDKFKDYKKLRYILEKNICYTQNIKNLIFCNENQPLGFIFFELDVLNKKCKIISFHIRHKFKNKGIGTLLFNEMEKI